MSVHKTCLKNLAKVHAAAERGSPRMALIHSFFFGALPPTVHAKALPRFAEVIHSEQKASNTL
jgi:hypothetical protein